MLHPRTLIVAIASFAAMAAVTSGCTTPPPSPVAPTSTSTATTAAPPTTTPPPTTTSTATTAAPPTTTAPSPAAGTGLDHSGRTIPTTNYPIPSGAIFLSPTGDDTNSGTDPSKPVRSLNAAVGAAPTGGTIVVRGGTHRTWLTTGTATKGVYKNLTIQAYPGEQPWFDGSDIVTGWASDGAGHWVKDWATPTFCAGKYYDFAPNAQSKDAAGNGLGPCTHADNYDATNPFAGDPQQAFVNGTKLRQAASVADVNGTSFYYDWSTKRMYIGSDPAVNTIELVARPSAITLGSTATSVNTYLVRGVGFRRYGSNEFPNATMAAVVVGGSVSTFENVVFADNSGSGLGYSDPKPGSSASRSVFVGNGDNGLRANGSVKAGTRNDLLLDGNVFNGNNAQLYGTACNLSCAAANVKLAHMFGFAARNNVFENAKGRATGLWCDLDCRQGVMVGNTARNNGKHGIFYEVSSGGIIASNLLANNGAMGLKVSAANTKIYNNTVVVNQAASASAQGIQVYDDNRAAQPGEIGPDTSNVELVNNIVVAPSGTLVVTNNLTGGQTNTSQYFSRFANNAYQHGTDNVYSWAGTLYKSTAAFTAATGYDTSTLDLTSTTDPYFVNAASGDFHVRTGSPAKGTGAALPSDVAAATKMTGVSPIDRGAFTYATI